MLALRPMWAPCSSQECAQMLAASCMDQVFAPLTEQIRDGHHAHISPDTAELCEQMHFQDGSGREEGLTLLPWLLVAGSDSPVRDDSSTLIGSNAPCSCTQQRRA